jgi:hypothetical protein
MEKVEGLLRNLKLSEAEKKGVRLSGEVGKQRAGEAKALGMVLLEKPANVEGLEVSLGRIWCPLKGLRCKELGANVFMFTFLQESGKRKALDDGPWKFNNDLLVMMDFDPNKTLEEYTFDTIPICLRVLKLPLGRMNRDTGEAIGDEVGEFIQVDVREDDMAIGEYLRVKVKLNIKEPLR